MVGVASSNLVAPTKFGRKIKHLAVTPGAFFVCGLAGHVAQSSGALLLNLSNLFPSLVRALTLVCALWLTGLQVHADGLIHHGPRMDIQIERGSERLSIFKVNQLRQGDKVLVKPVQASLAKGDWVLMLGRISPAGNEVATKAFDLARLDGYAELEMTANDQVPVILLAPQLRNMFGLYTSFLESELLLKEVIQSDPQRFYDLQKVDQVNQAITALTQGLDQMVVNRSPEQAIAEAKAMAFKFGVNQVDPDCFKGNAVNTQCVALSIVANKDFVLPTSSDLGMLVGSKGAADLTKFLTDKLGVFSDAGDFLSHKFRDQYDFATTFGRPLSGTLQTELFSLARFRNGHIKTAYVYVPAWFKAAAPMLSADVTRPACFMDEEVRLLVVGRLPVANYWHAWVLSVQSPQHSSTLSLTDVTLHPERGVFKFKMPAPLPESLLGSGDVTLQLRGRVGFDAVELPPFTMALPVRGDVSAGLQGAGSLVAGERGELSLGLAQGAACIDGMSLKLTDGTVVTSSLDAPHKLAVDLSQSAPGPVSLTVRIKGAPAQTLPLRVLAARAQVLSVEHAELDDFMVVTGRQLSRLASLKWDGGACQPREMRSLADGKEQLTMACNVDLRNQSLLPQSVVLHHQNDEPAPLKVRLLKSAAAPRVALAASPNALLVRPSAKALQWGLKPQEEFVSDDSGLSMLLQTVDGYVPGKGSYTLQLRFVDDPVTAKKPITAPLMADLVHKELRTRQPVRFKGAELPSVINPLEFRVLHDASGLFSRWMPLGRAVLMLPEISSISCAPQTGRVWLHGTQLDLVDGARFMDPAAKPAALDAAQLEPCPDGLCLSLPSPERQHKLFVSLGWVSQRVFPVDVGAVNACKAP